MSNVGDIQNPRGEWFAEFQTGFHADPIDAVFKALGVEWQPSFCDIPV